MKVYENKSYSTKEILKNIKDEKLVKINEHLASLNIIEKVKLCKQILIKGIH